MFSSVWSACEGLSFRMSERGVIVIVLIGFQRIGSRIVNHRLMPGLKVAKLESQFSGDLVSMKDVPCML